MRTLRLAVLWLSLTVVFCVGVVEAAPSLPLKVRRMRLFEEALRQAEKPTADWDPAQRDCAGFIRFLYRKSTGDAPVRWKTVAGTREAYAPASDLVGWNFEPLGRDLSRLQLATGDLLAFRKPKQAPGEDWHLMMVLKAPEGAEARALVVYHNGATGAEAGVRKLWLTDLQSESSREWSVALSNPRFMGVFRHPDWFEQRPVSGVKRESE